MLIVYTAMIGETDTVRRPTVIDPAVRYVCFSDRPPVPPYDWVPVPTADDGTPPSRLYKVLQESPILEAAEATLWHDASYQLTRDLEWARLVLATHDLVALPHPRRTRIEDEGAAVARWGYVTTDTARAYVAGYRAEGFTANRVSSGGLFARRRSPAVMRFNAIWWQEVQRWRYRDQASLDYSAFCAGLTIHHVAGTVRDNPYARWREPQEVAS